MTCPYHLHRTHGVETYVFITISALQPYFYTRKHLKSEPRVGIRIQLILIHLWLPSSLSHELVRFSPTVYHACVRTSIIIQRIMIRHANIAAVVVVVLHVAHLHRVVESARASSVAAAHLCPSPPPPRRTSSSAPSGRHRSPWTRSGARSARTNCWSSM